MDDPLRPQDPAPAVEFDELLAAEFDYIAQTAIQAHEDRARVSSFYLIAVGSLVAAMFGTQFFDLNSPSQTVNLMLSGLFALLTLQGTFTVLQLARLRSAWHESALAMNQLKEYMIERDKTLAGAFRWQTGTLPPKEKQDSISYFQALETALIGGLMLGAAVFFLQRAFWQPGLWRWIVSAVTGGGTAYLHLLLYRRALR